MPIQILMPALSPTMEEGKLAKWLVEEGQAIKAGMVIAEIETDKATMEVEAVDEGTIGRILVAEGTEKVQVNQPIVSVLQNDPLTAVIHVIERDYSKVRVGQEAAITTDAYPQQTFTGTIARIAPLLKESSRQGRVEIEVPNAGQLLKPGMFVRARLEFARRENAQLVPLAALARREGEQGVFVADLAERKAHFVPAVPGIVEGETVEIVEPALAGPVVTLGNHLLEEGASIVLAAAAGPASGSPPGGAARAPAAGPGN